MMTNQRKSRLNLSNIQENFEASSKLLSFRVCILEMTLLRANY